MEKIPVIYLEIDETDQNSGVDAISFVTNPATQIGWEMFANQKKNVKTTFKKDELKQVVTGPVMLAETPIYRYNTNIGEYFVKFSVDTIFSMMKKYFKQGKIHRVNEEHNGNRVVTDVVMIESFIVGDRTKSELYPDLPKGSWVASFHIENTDYWNNVIMSNEFTGFSLEGLFSENISEALNTHLELKIKSILDSSISDDAKKDKIKSIVKNLI